MFQRLVRILVALLALTVCTSTAFAQAADSGKAAATKTSKTPKSKLVDINSASKDALDALPGITAYSQKIIDGRPYNSKRDLVTRNIIPQATYDGIKNQIVAHRTAAKKAAGKAASSVAPK